MAASTQSPLAERELVISRVIDAPLIKILVGLVVIIGVKAFCMFMSMDKMVGGQFEQGLAQMKSVAEAANKT